MERACLCGNDGIAGQAGDAQSNMDMQIRSEGGWGVVAITIRSECRAEIRPGHSALQSVVVGAARSDVGRPVTVSAATPAGDLCGRCSAVGLFEQPVCGAPRRRKVGQATEGGALWANRGRLQGLSTEFAGLVSATTMTAAMARHRCDVDLGHGLRGRG